MMLPSPLFFDTLHVLWQLGVVYNAWFAGGLDYSSGLVHAVEVGGAADVFAAVLRVHPAEVHRDITEVIDRCESVFCEDVTLIK